MSYQVLARKWRPRTFGEVVGQEHVLRALINALDNDRLHHAYLFTGTRGVGKTTLGRILAKSLNCEQGVGATPCGQCTACREIDEGRFVDLIEVDAASRTKVEDTRELMDNVQYAPTRGRYKVYLIDEVHMLSNHSFNALLKTLEEPPPHVKFLLATTDPQKLPVTILSRCLKFNLKVIPRERISAHLADILEREGVAHEAPGVALIAQAADGSMRDALSLLDQAIAFGGGAVKEADVAAMLGTIGQDRVLGLLESLGAGDGQQALQQIHSLAEQGADFPQVLAEVISVLHRLALLQTVPGAGVEEGGSGARLQALAATLSPEDVQLYYQIALLGRRDLPLAPDPRGGFEMIALRMLAFRPATAAPSRGMGEPASARVPNPASARVSNPAPARVPNPAPARPSNSSPTSAPASRPGSSPAPGVSSPASAPGDEFAATAIAEPPPPAAQTPAPPTPRSASTAAPGVVAEDWSKIVAALGLGGLLRQLAVNCALDGMDDDVVRLRLGKSHAQLASQNMVERLQSALQDHFQRPLRVALDVADRLDGTPAAEEARERAARQQAAVKDIEADPNVRAMEEMFDATVDHQSIRPVE